ncbi:MAG: biotin/lipoyl-containing protein, partial [Lysobacter sp.]
MASSIEVKVPDIGDYDDVPVIELLVAVGDTVKKDQGLVTLESDKATMEVPSPADGVVKSISVKIGDKVSEGAVIAILEAAGETAVAEEKQAPLPPAGEVAARSAAGEGAP